MIASIESGKNWTITSTGQKDTVCKNEVLGVFVRVMDWGQKLKIPAPHGIDPKDAMGEGVTISQVKDEEGQSPPQEFLNLPSNAWIAFFPGDKENALKIMNNHGEGNA